MIEINYIVGSLEVGGAERHLSQVLPSLKKMGFSIKIIVLSNKATLKPIFEKAGISVAIGPNFNFLPKFTHRPLNLMASIIRLITSFLTNRHAIRHSFLPEAYLLVALAARITCFKGPLIMSRRSLNNYQQRRPMLGKLEKLFHRFTTFALGNSQSVVQQLYQEGFDHQKVKLIYNGIETNLYQTLPSKTDLRNNLGLEPDVLIFIIVANLIPYKGHIDLLNAFAIISKNLPKNWQLLCAGKDNGILTYLKDQACILGIKDHVKFLGSRSDTAQLQSAADIGILCSHEEGFSNAILESMAVGLPMVVTNVGGNAEAVQDFVTGLVVEPKNPETLANALLTLALDGNMRCTFGKAGKERVGQHFTLAQCSQQYADFYKSL